MFRCSFLIFSSHTNPAACGISRFTFSWLWTSGSEVRKACSQSFIDQECQRTKLHSGELSQTLCCVATCFTQLERRRSLTRTLCYTIACRHWFWLLGEIFEICWSAAMTSGWCTCQRKWSGRERVCLCLWMYLFLWGDVYGTVHRECSSGFWHQRLHDRYRSTLLMLQHALPRWDCVCVFVCMSCMLKRGHCSRQRPSSLSTPSIKLQFIKLGRRGK